MIVKTLTISKLYGYMDKKIDFRNDINLLVGINGSGKTSILNIINWLTKPSFDHLCTTEFKALTLVFIYNNNEYTIKCTQSLRKLTLSVIGPKSLHPLTVILKTPTPKITALPKIKDEIIELYRSLQPDEKEAETWQFFRELPKPIIVGLDRTVFSNNEEHIATTPSRSKPIKVSYSLTPLDIVKELATKEYAKYKTNIINLNNQLKNHLMFSSFDLVDKFSPETNQRNTVTLSKITKLEEKVYKYLTTENSNSHVANQKDYELNYEKISSYFTKLKAMIEKGLPDNKDVNASILFLINSHHFGKIKALIQAFEKFEDDSAKAYASFKTFLDVINAFFKDTSKRVIFSEEKNQIRFRLLDSDNKPVGDDRDIKLLSSGEHQVLILFCYLAFNLEGSRLFIIDEPELSLHPKWQEEFLPAVKQLMPHKTQLIIATHSPAIVGKSTEYCNVQYPFNSANRG